MTSINNPEVSRPDWSRQTRLRYTNVLIVGKLEVRCRNQASRVACGFERVWLRALKRLLVFWGRCGPARSRKTRNLQADIVVDVRGDFCIFRQRYIFPAQ